VNPTTQTEADAPGEPAPPRLTFREVPWRLADAAVALVPFLAVILVALVVPLRTIPPLLALPVALLSYAWMLLYPLAVARRNGWSLRRSTRHSRVVTELLVASFTVLGAWGLLAAGYLLWAAVFGEPRASGNPLVGATLSANPVLLAVVLVLACVAAPLTEEVAFRGLLYNALRRVSSRGAAILIQAAAFGFMHATYSVSYAVATAVIGAVFGLVYEARKTLLTPILCHALHNAAAAVLVLVALGWTTDPPALGVSVAPHDYGALVTDVTPGSGAESAGIRAGDILYAVNGYGVRNAQDVGAAFRDKKSGEVIAVEYIRDEQLYRVEVVLRSRRELSGK
jgi:membrane protease YdiL (CAAX protease family)